MGTNVQDFALRITLNVERGCLSAPCGCLFRVLCATS